MSKTSALFRRFVLLFLCGLIVCFMYHSGVVAQAEHENHGFQTNQDETDILQEIYEINPNFHYEGELLSVSKTVRTIDDETDQGTLVNGLFGTNDMTVYITVSRIDDSENDTFHLSATAVWNMVPIWRMQDGFALAWDKDFALIQSTATASYKSIGVTNGKTQLITQTPNTGVGYAVECSHYYAQALDWVRIDAVVSQRDRDGIANVRAAYGHRIASLGIGNSMDTMISDTSFSY